MNKFSQQKLPEDFYLQDAVSAAENLLGKIIVKKYGNTYLQAVIVETEAYKGSIDLAAHSFNGKTPRNSVMFEPGGKLYVYFTYGMHYCANIVTGEKGEGDAVLIRAVEPLNGEDIIAKNRFPGRRLNSKDKINLTNGPAKFAQAFDIKKKDNGLNLLGDNFFILDSQKLTRDKITVTTRIGIKKSVDLPWRFYITKNKYVSKK